MSGDVRQILPWRHAGPAAKQAVEMKFGEPRCCGDRRKPRLRAEVRVNVMDCARDAREIPAVDETGAVGHERDDSRWASSRDPELAALAPLPSPQASPSVTLRRARFSARGANGANGQQPRLRRSQQPPA